MSGGLAGPAAGSRGKGTSAMIPAGSRKLVQSLKEIVNCSEAEIFTMLRDCNMDPNEAVHRLLSQDTFHEVKSKRDKKKEIRESPESWSRTVNSSSGRARGGTERSSRGTSQSTYTDHGASKGKVVHKEENCTNVLPTSSFLESSTFSSNSPQRTTVQSNSAFIEVPVQAASIADNNSVPMQASSGFPTSWSGRSGHMSMADIVKMGRPQVKSVSIAQVASERSHMVQNAAMPNMPQHDVKQSPIAVLSVESDEIPEPFQESTHVFEITQDLGIAEGQHISQDGWSIHEQPIGNGSTTLDMTGSSAVYANKSELTSSNLVDDGRNLHIDPHSEENQQTEDSLNVANLPENCESASASASDRQKEVDTSVDPPYLNDGLQKDMNPHHSERVELDRHEGSFLAGGVRMEISSAAADLRQLSVNEETNEKYIDPNPAVIIPDHLRVTNADCAHLSFGSFVFGTFSGSLPSKPLKNDLEVIAVTDDAATINGLDVRNHENYSDEQLRPTLTEHVASRSGTVENLDMPSASQTEVVRNDPSDAAQSLQYNLPSVSGYAFSSSTEPTAAKTYPQGNTQMQNISPFTNLMQPNALHSSLLAASIPSLRDLDLPLSPLLTTQSMPSNFTTSLSSSSGPTISMPEALNPGAFANPQSTPQSLHSTTTALTSPALAQHLPVHHYSQPALPLGHFANMIGYPFLPQSYTYLPSFANSPFHQTPAVPGVGMKYSQPQYKSNQSVTSLPQASAIASGYGGFGSSANVPGTLNHSTSSASTTIGLDEALSLQYKEANYMPLLQQSENPAMWIHGPGARTMSALQPNTFYNYQGQNQLGGLRQSQQSSQFGALGYPSLYHSQMGPSREHQQNPSEGNMNGSQSIQSQLTNQIWQHGY